MLKYCAWIAIAILTASCSVPKSAFDVVAQSKQAPVKIEFNNRSENALDYHWDFGDGMYSTEVNPKHTYLLSGRYKVKLTAAKNDKSALSESEIFVQAPEACLVILHTSEGDMIAKLFGDTPRHQDNFIKLAEEGYYNDLLFHRVIKGFMVQAGDPDSREAGKGTALGKGGPDYTIEHEIKDTLFHVKGALAAARLSDDVNPQKSSSGSQFYIVHGRPHSSEEIENNEYEKGIRYSKEAKEVLVTMGGAPALDQEYTVFGQIIEGFDVLDMIAEQRTDPRDRPHEDVKILKITVIK
ncbi:MAG: peptidylprolyl isomerase [Chitinophagales bacterium]|nr:peptidylprolyl isomerase [Chitinophagales bacterium]